MNEHDNNIDPNIAYSSNTNQNYDDKYYERYLQQLSESDPIAFQNFISNFSSASNNNSVVLPDGKTELSHDGKIKQKDDGILITPIPEFVIKTFLLPKDQALSSSSSSSVLMGNKDNKNNKIFINVCSNEMVQEPKTIKKIDENNKEVEGYNIPISVGPVRSCHDKSNILCNVIDCIVNTTVIELSINDSSYRSFLIQVVLEYVNNKYFSNHKVNNKSISNVSDDDKFISRTWSYIDTKNFKLPKMRYIGYVNNNSDNDTKQESGTNNNNAIPKQWIRDQRNIPKIEEVGINHNNNNTNSNNNKIKYNNDVMKNDNRKSALLPINNHVSFTSSTDSITDITEKVTKYKQKQKQEQQKVVLSHDIHYEIFIQGEITAITSNNSFNDSSNKSSIKDISLLDFIQHINKGNNSVSNPRIVQQEIGNSDGSDSSITHLLHPLIYDMPEKGVILSYDKEKSDEIFHACKLCLQSKNINQELLKILKIDVSPYVITFSSSASCSDLATTTINKTECILPFAIIPKSVECTNDAKASTLTILATLDENVTSSMERYPDPGSKTWNLQNALSSNNNDNVNKVDTTINTNSDSLDKNINSGKDDKKYAKFDKDDDHHHDLLNKDKNNDSYEEDEYATDDVDNDDKYYDQLNNLPEDKFHALDPMSQFLLEQQKD